MRSAWSACASPLGGAANVIQRATDSAMAESDVAESELAEPDLAADCAWRGAAVEPAAAATQAVNNKAT